MKSTRALEVALDEVKRVQGLEKELNARTTLAEGQLIELRKKREADEARFSQMRSDMEKLSGEVDRATKEVEASTKELQVTVLTKDREAGSAKVISLEEQVVKLTQQIAAEEPEREELETLNSKLSFDNEELTRQNTSLKENIAELKARLESANTPGFVSPKPPKSAKKLASLLRPSPMAKL